jgi:hypothetical protein
MAKLIIYKPNGDIFNSCDLNFETLKPSVLGEMVRVTLKNKDTYEGFADEPYLSGKGKYLTLKHYDIDYEKFGLRSQNMVTISIPLEIIDKLEAILYSNPRWGHPPVNEFLFDTEFKHRMIELHNIKSNSQKNDLE